MYGICLTFIVLWRLLCSLVFGVVGAIKCFSCLHEIDVPKSTVKSISVCSSPSASTHRDVRKFGSGFNSQNVSYVSTESFTRISFTSISRRQSTLREFTFDELKMATRNFSRSLMVGEGGFGCVYRGVMRDTEASNKKIDIAVKQLGTRGLQARFLSLAIELNCMVVNCFLKTFV